MTGVALVAVLAAAVASSAPAVASTTTGGTTRAPAVEEPAFSPPPFVRSWPDGALDVTVAANGEVFTASGAATVSRYSAFGEPIGSWSVPRGSAYDVAVAPNGNVWVTTSYSDVVEYTPEGEVVRDWEPNDLGGIYSPSDIAVTPEGHVVLLGPISGLSEWDLDAHKVRGNWVDVFQGYGALQAMGIGPDGHFDVSAAVTAGENIPAILRVAANWQSRTLTFGTFTWPTSIAFAADGTEYIADAEGADRVAVFRDAAPVGTIGSAGTGPGQFDDPEGVAVSPTTGDVYVADHGNGRIQVFGHDADEGPTIDLHTPGAGAAYAIGQDVAADYSCTDAGSGTDACTGTVADGAAIDTSTAGAHQFTVSAIDLSAHLSRTTHTYTVGGAARPDGIVRAGATGTDRGDDVYDATGATQTVSRRGAAGTAQAFFIRLQNDAPYPDVLRLSGRASANGYRVTYRTGGDDVTAAVVDGTFTTATLAPGEAVVVEARVKITDRAATASSFTGRATIRSTEPDAPIDRVGFILHRR